MSRYGTDPSRRFEAAMDALTDAIAWTRTERYRNWEHQYRSGIMTIERPTELTADATGRLVTVMHDQFREALPLSESFYVSGEAQDLLDIARESLPPARLDASDVLVPRGFAWLEREYEKFHDRNNLAAFSWVVTHLVGSDPVVILAAYTAKGGIVGPYQVMPLTLGEVIDEAKTSGLCRLAITFWLLAQQRQLVSNPQEVGRAVRRRAKAQEIKTVTTVTLRRRSYPEADGSRRVDWSHRWLVRGFWRNQWFPSEQRNKPIWVADYVKGPPDKPFVAKRRSFEFTR